MRAFVDTIDGRRDRYELPVITHDAVVTKRGKSGFHAVLGRLQTGNCIGHGVDLSDSEGGVSLGEKLVCCRSALINRNSGFHSLRGRDNFAGAAGHWSDSATRKKSAASPGFGGIHDRLASIVVHPALIFEGFHKRLWWEMIR